MSGPIAGVSPNSNGWLGGSYLTSNLPTNVGGSLATPGASSFPGPRAPPISEARNDRGTNITIPYARVVPNLLTYDPPDSTTKIFSNNRTEKLVAGTIAFIWQGANCWLEPSKSSNPAGPCANLATQNPRAAARVAF
jgi:hypothetical protein